MANISSAHHQELATTWPWGGGGGWLKDDAGKDSPSVLIVDDESLMRWSVRQTLANYGFDVVRASDGASAVRALADASRPFDVVVLDLQLPDKTSLSLLTLVRTMSPSSVVMVTTGFETPEVTEAVRRGARLVLRKPFELDDLATAVLEACGGEA